MASLLAWNYTRSHRFLRRRRSTRMKATSSAEKPRASTSPAPWSTSSRSASGYRRQCLKACWRKRGKTRVSPASRRVRAPESSPVLPLTPSWSFSSNVADSPRLSPVFSRSRLRLLTRRPHADPETAFPAEDTFARLRPPKGPNTPCLDCGFRRSSLQSGTRLLLLLNCTQNVSSLANFEPAGKRKRDLYVGPELVARRPALDSPPPPSSMVSEAACVRAGKRLLFLKLPRTFVLDRGCVCCSYSLYNSAQTFVSVNICIRLIPPLLFLRLTRLNRKGDTFI